MRIEPTTSRFCSFSFSPRDWLRYDWPKKKLFYLSIHLLVNLKIPEKPVVAPGPKCVTVTGTGCGFPIRRNNIFFTFGFLFLNFFALVSKRGVEFTYHATPPELSGKWGTECLKKLGSLCLFCWAGYSVKLILVHMWYMFSIKLRASVHIIKLKVIL